MERSNTLLTNKEFCVLHVVEYNYILPSSTVRIQLHVSAVYVGRRQVEIQLTDQLYKMCGVFVWGLGVIFLAFLSLFFFHMCDSPSEGENTRQ